MTGIITRVNPKNLFERKIPTNKDTVRRDFCTWIATTNLLRQISG